MQVEQAIFTSARTQTAHGYHLVSRSPGIDRQTAQALSHWGPTQGALADTDPTSESLNCCPLDDDRIAISRSTFGGPEYSGRGGLQVITFFLVLHKSQLQGYADNPLAVLRTAYSLGKLHLTALQSELTAVELPCSSLIGLLPHNPAKALGDDRRSEPIINESIELLKRRQRVALVDVADPVETLDCVLQRLPVEHRREISFSTGLCPTEKRVFQLQFLSGLPQKLRRQLESRDVHCLLANTSRMTLPCTSVSRRSIPL